MKMGICSWIILLVLPVAVLSQGQVVTWKADLRLRSEADMRDFRDKTPANVYSLLRARLAADVSATEKVRIFLQLQDSRVFGSEPTTLSNTANLDLHQGYVQVSDFVFDGLTAQAGRMEVSYGSQRFIGAVGWNNVGRSFDGLRLSSRQSFGTVDLFALNTGETTAAPGSATPAAVAYVREAGQFLGGAYASVTSAKPMLIDVFLFYESDRSQTVPGTNRLSRYTAGGAVQGDAGSLWYQAEAAYQFGKVAAADLGAYLLSGMAGMNVSKTGIQRFGVGADLLSGTPAGSTKNSTFVPAYHTGHKFYGFMDYFVGIPAAGLYDIIGTVRYAVNEAVSVDVTGHMFRNAEEVPLLGKDLGIEGDVVATWKYDAATSLQFGLSGFQPGDVMKAAYGGSDVSYWGFAVIQVSL